MNTLSIDQVAETASTFRELAENHGGLFVMGGEHQTLHRPDLYYATPDPNNPAHKPLNELVAQGAGIVPVAPNFDKLSRSPGREFGLMVPNQGIYPAVITPQSRPSGAREQGDPGQLHVAYLTNEQDEIDPTDIAQGAGDPLNGLLLQASNTLYGVTIGAHGADGQMVPGELGHRYGGLRVLSDPNVAAAIRRGVDVTDGLAASGGGLAVNITAHNDDKNTAGTFDMMDDRGQVRRLTYATAALSPRSGAILIDHPSFNQDVRRQLGGLEPAMAATGLAIIAKMSREDQTGSPRQAVRAYSQQALGAR